MNFITFCYCVDMFGVLLSYFLSASALASQPRLDLYNQIKTETGVSLRKAYQAVALGNHEAAADLQIYARRSGIGPIEKALEEEISSRKADCKKHNTSVCNESVTDLEGQLENLRSMQQNFSKLSRLKQLYFSLLVYGYNIKFKVLRSDLEAWDKSCGSQDKINTRSCQEKLFEIHSLADIAYDLSVLSLAKIQGETIRSDIQESIKERIARYEK